MSELEIVYRDSQLVAVNKPAGLLVHRSPLDSRETRFAVQLLRDQLGCRVHPVHRLDKPTSGVLLFALNQETAAAAARIFARGETSKTYLTVVRGYLDEEGEIDYPLPELNETKVRAEDAVVKECITRYRCLGRVELPYAVDRYPCARYSLALVTPLTGRRHQIRRHLAHIFHPIIGDVRHGVGTHNRFFREHFQVSRLLLAAVELVLPHPTEQDSVRITARIDEDFFKVIQELGWGAAVNPEFLPVPAGPRPELP